MSAADLVDMDDIYGSIDRLHSRAEDLSELARSHNVDPTTADRARREAVRLVRRAASLRVQVEGAQ